MGLSSATILLAIFSCLVALANSKTLYHAKSNSVATLLKREKPFATPSKPPLLESYERPKRQVLPVSKHNIQQFQNFLMRTKEICAYEMGYPPINMHKSLLYEDNPNPQEKCLMECILKRAEIMDDSNKLSIRKIRHIAELISNHNPLIVSIALATAENCNRHLHSHAPCEAASQISRCIANEMRAHRIKLMY